MASSGSSHSSPPPFGVYTPLLTFFNQDETIDYTSITSHINRVLSAGVRGLLVLGSHGEATHLSNQERIDLIAHARSVIQRHTANSNATIIAGCSANSVRGTLGLIGDAKDAGAEYALVLPPSYWPHAMTKDVIESFYLKVAASSPIPILIYNNPTAVSGIDLSSELMTRIALATPNLVGAKLSCGSAGKLTRLTSSPIGPARFRPFVGKADVLLPGLMAGSNGIISAVANIAPRVLVEVVRLHAKGDLEEAQKIQGLLAHADVALHSLGISGVKSVCVRWFGYGSAHARAPLPLVKEGSVDGVSEKLQKVIDLEKALMVTG